MKKVIKNMMILGMTAISLAGCGSATQTTASKGSSDADEIIIGGNWALTGNYSSYGVVQNNAIKLAIDERNADGGIDGKKVKYVEHDTKSSVEEATNGANRLIDVEKAAIILGPVTTGEVQAQVPVITDRKIPMITATATGDSITKDANGKVLDYVFRDCFQDSFQGGAIAEFANEKGFDKVAILKDNSSDYGQNLTTEFKAKYKGTVVAEESYVAKETDFQAILTNIKNSGANAIYIAGYYEEAGLIIKQAREMGIEIPILGPDGFGSEEINNLAGKENMTNIYFASHFVFNDQSSQEVKDFQKNYKDKYGTDPDMFAALAYDAANMAMDAIQRAGSTDGEAIQKALASTTDFKGITGTFSIDKNHNPIKTVYIQEVQNGEKTSATAIEPSDVN